MKMKKIVSAFSALAMTVTAMAGLAVTANAETVPVTLTYVDYSNPDAAMGYVTGEATATTGYNRINNGNIGFPNTGWGVNYIAYIKVDASSVEGTMTNATLSLDMSGPTSGSRDVEAGIGYTAYTDWDNTLTYNTAVANGMNSITTVGDMVTQTSRNSTVFETKTFSIMDVIQEDADKIVTIAVYATTPAGTYIKNVSVDITATQEAVYDVTFSETHGADITVMYNGANVTEGTSLPAGNYSFTATAPGYEDYSGSFEVVDGDVNVEFTMTPRTSAETLTVNYGYNDADETFVKIGDKVMDVSSNYIGDTVNYYYPVVVENDGKYYSIEEASGIYYGGSKMLENVADEVNVVYTAMTEDVVYYAEFTEGSAGSYSSRYSDGDAYIGATMQIDNIAAGKYTVYVGFRSGSGTSTVTVLNGEDELGTASTTATTKGAIDIELSSPATLTVSGTGRAEMDYVYIVKTGDVEPEPTTAEEVTVEGETGVKAFKVTEFALNGTAPTWSITATPAEGDAQIQTIEAEIANVEAGNVSLGLIIDNVPENVTVSATLGY